MRGVSSFTLVCLFTAKLFCFNVVFRKWARDWAKLADNQNKLARQNILNLSPSEKERLSQQQIVFNEIEKDQLPSNVNFPLIKNAEGMVIKYDPNVIELKK